MERSWKRQVARFCHQYLQLEQTLDYPESQYLKLSDVQNAISVKLFAAESLPNGGPPVRYQARVLKELVSRIEASIDDWDEYGVSDDLMSSLSVLLSTPGHPEADAVQKKCHVIYHLSSLPVDDAHITLLESRSLISASGTTGLRTWEAALHLGQFLCQNPNIVAGKRILELGAGTGYLSILCAKYLQSTHVIASDGSDDVVNNFPDNFFLNQLQGSNSIMPMELKWGHALVGTEEQRWNGGRSIDVVLGADITYDHSVILSLIGTLLDLFELHPWVEVVIAATQRNQQTFQIFLDKCQLNRLDVKDLPFQVPSGETQDGPFYNDHVVIRICKVSKQ
ncbi:Protein-lysine N-methyltransferase EFM3 [Cladobotryum mycophilum]|uniref:Protein-lysine N-methyltransferase EFM3 n=1 Tax=Cladobotryum mycophilum TaxID=491253 RepID=A0ABR0SIY6_9HYPO